MKECEHILDKKRATVRSSFELKTFARQAQSIVDDVRDVSNMNLMSSIGASLSARQNRYLVTKKCS